MTVDIGSGSARFEIGRVIRRMSDVIGKNFASFIALSLIFSLPGLIFTFRGVLAIYLHIPIQPWLPPNSISAVLANSTGAFGISLVFQKMLEASVTHAMMASRNGGKASFAECFATSLKNMLPLTAIALMEFVAVVLGLAVLIVPGILLLLMFSVVAPVRVTEHTGIRNVFNRSAKLTYGHKSQIFALFVVYYVLAIAIGLSLRPLAGLPFFGAGAAENSLLAFMLLSGVTRVFLGLLVAAGVASIYYELRLAKEGYEPERLAAVFS